MIGTRRLDSPLRQGDTEIRKYMFPIGVEVVIGSVSLRLCGKSLDRLKEPIE